VIFISGKSAPVQVLVRKSNLFNQYEFAKDFINFAGLPARAAPRTRCPHAQRR
jgi:hypothetical protein